MSVPNPPLVVQTDHEAPQLQVHLIGKSTTLLEIHQSIGHSYSSPVTLSGLSLLVGMWLCALFARHVWLV